MQRGIELRRKENHTCLVGIEFNKSNQISEMETQRK